MVDEYEAEAAVIESNLNQNNLQMNIPVVSTTIGEELTKEKEQLSQELYINKEEDYIPIRKKYVYIYILTGLNNFKKLK